LSKCALLESCHAAVADKAWTDLVYGYSNADQAAIELTNSGETTLSDVKAELKDGTAFQIVSSPAGQISAGQKTTVVVKPVNGLGAGSYSDTLVISTANGSASITLKATVAKGENTAVVTLTKTSVTSDSVPSAVRCQEQQVRSSMQYPVRRMLMHQSLHGRMVLLI